MRILYYSPHPELNFHAPTGYGRHMREMVAAFREAGHEVDLLIGGGDRVMANSKPASVKKNASRKMIPPLAWQSARDLALLRFDRRMGARLALKIAEFKPDMVYERVAYLQASGVRTCRKVGIFHFAEVNAPFPEERHYFSGKSLLIGLSRKIEREIFTQTNAMSTVSEALRRYALRVATQVEGKISVIPNAIDPNGLPNRLNGKAIRADLNVANHIVIGFVGSVFAYHGVDLLIKGFAKIESQYPATLLIVGDGAILPELRRMAAQLGIAEKVHFTGSVRHADVYHYIDAMDICCMTKSNWYGSPVKIFEYGLLAKAILAPNVAPVRDVMTESDGKFCEPDVEDIAKKLSELLQNKALREELGLHWNRKVLSNYTWAHAAQKVLDLCT